MNYKISTNAHIEVSKRTAEIDGKEIALGLSECVILTVLETIPTDCSSDALKHIYEETIKKHQTKAAMDNGILHETEPYESVIARLIDMNIVEQCGGDDNSEEIVNSLEQYSKDKMQRDIAILLFSFVATTVVLVCGLIKANLGICVLALIAMLILGYEIISKYYAAKYKKYEAITAICTERHISPLDIAGSRIYEFETCDEEHKSFQLNIAAKSLLRSEASVGRKYVILFHKKGDETISQKNFISLNRF